MADGLAILLSSVSHAGLGGPLDDANGFIFYREIHGFLSDALRNYGVNLFERFVSWAGVAALALLTLWTLIRGYRIMTGRSRESMTVFVIEMMKAVIIVSIATGASLGAGDLHEWVSYDLGNLINRLGTGKSTDLFESVDRSLGYMQLAFGVIDGIQVGENRELQSFKDMSMFMVFVGSGIPAIVAGALLLLYEIMAALTLGFSPLFVLCLLFPQTRQLFWGWLYYLLGTLFSLAVLSVMAALAMDMICAVAAAFWVGKFTGANPEGVNSLALQQGGLGLLLTALIVTAPRIAAQFFKGMLADFTPFSAFGSGAAPRSAANSQPHAEVPTYARPPEREPAPMPTHAHRVVTPKQAQADEVKQAADMRSFSERYPNATASLDGHGGSGDPLPNDIRRSALHSMCGALTSDLNNKAKGMIGYSPTLQADLVRLGEEKWSLVFAKEGSKTFRNKEPRTIAIDEKWREDAKETMRALSHEIGHATHKYVADYSSKESYLNGVLADEAAAMMKNLEIRREILSNSNGSVDIGINGTASNHDAYNAAYDRFLKDEDRRRALDEIGQIFADKEHVRLKDGRTTTYRDYYGDWYEQKYGR